MALSGIVPFALKSLRQVRQHRSVSPSRRTPQESEQSWGPPPAFCFSASIWKS